jgi:hypothetical protein
MPALDQALLGPRLEGRIELVHQRLNHRLEQLAGGLEDQFPEISLEGQQLLPGRMLV